MAKYIYKNVGVDGMMVPFTCSPVSLIEGTNSNMMASIHYIALHATQVGQTSTLSLHIWSCLPHDTVDADMVKPFYLPAWKPYALGSNILIIELSASSEVHYHNLYKSVKISTTADEINSSPPSHADKSETSSIVGMLYIDMQIHTTSYINVSETIMLRTVVKMDLVQKPFYNSHLPSREKLAQCQILFHAQMLW